MYIYNKRNNWKPFKSNKLIKRNFQCKQFSLRYLLDTHTHDLLSYFSFFQCLYLIIWFCLTFLMHQFSFVLRKFTDMFACGQLNIIHFVIRVQVGTFLRHTRFKWSHVLEWPSPQRQVKLKCSLSCQSKWRSLGSTH